MFPEDYLENLTEAFSEKLTNINIKLLRSIGEGIKRVGYLNPSGVNIIKEMQRAGAEADKIVKEVAKALGEGRSFTRGIIEKAAKESYKDTEDFFDFRGKKQIPYKDNKKLQGFVKSAMKMTNGTFENLSETTVMTILGPNNEPITLPFKEAYKEIIDRAITTSQLGYSSFDAEMKNILKQCGRSGLRVQYESGRTRRLDTAVRYNILDGLRQVQQDVRDDIGEEFGADGVELTAHSNCAKDHEDIQGKQFTKEEFEKLNNRLKRPIGKHNCRHRAYSIILGVSKPAYSEEELEAFKKKNNKKITFEGKELTKYEATQLQRKLETEMRYTADTMEIAKASDNKELIGAMKNKSQWISRKYQELSVAADIPMQKDRMWIYRKGGKMVDEVIQEGLTSAGGDGIIYMNRQTKNTGAYSELQEYISKKNIRKKARKFGIDLKGYTINIDKQEELLRFPIAARADHENIGGITFFPNAFIDEENLIRTIVHEMCHVRQFRKFGSTYVLNNYSIFEEEAEKEEQEFIEQLKKKGVL